MIIRTIQTESREYEQMAALRLEVLLRPVGVPLSYIDPVKEKHDILIGAFVAARMIGCCVLTQKEAGVVQLRQMAVTPDWQGKGVGAAIVEYAEKEARKKGFTRLIMHARSNVVPFYEKSGYQVVGDPFDEVGVEHRLMQKDLADG